MSADNLGNNNNDDGDDGGDNNDDDDDNKLRMMMMPGDQFYAVDGQDNRSKARFGRREGCSLEGKPQ